IIDTSHQCQIQSFKHVVMPPIVQVPALLFCKAYIDTMHMPPSYSYKYIVQAQNSLTSIGRTLGQFIFEEILCHWGELKKIVTNNEMAFIVALDWIADYCYI
ncbi:hypothetical protein AN958_11249, partial [Leucoagaricus sp. SymC.cos]